MSKQNTFPKDQLQVLQHLGKTGKATISEMVEVLGLDQVFISGAAQTLQELGLVVVNEETINEIKLGKAGESFIETGLPEKIIIKTLASAGEPLHINEVSSKAGLEQKIVGQSLKILKDKKWASKEGPALVITDTGKKAVDSEGSDEKLFNLLKSGESLFEHTAVKKYDFFQEGFESLKNRSQLLKIKERSIRTVIVTGSGKKVIAEGMTELIEETQLTPELLKDGKWKEVQFKPYDVEDDTIVAQAGKIHPYQVILNETRRIFLEMGFTEIASSHVESSFWGFDALFQPQDHPARDMQDTFFMEQPGEAGLPDDKLVKAVQAAHENGGDTGSQGWQYNWSSKIAKQTVLRTHTTAASIQAIHKNPNAPQKIFCIGRVFRRETVDYKHLPVFTQVDGIIVDENASLAQLIGLLKEFYRKMGFDKIEVRPAFFPYTEPSLEVFVYLKEREDWVEMGGAGIFRREVTHPMGCTIPVLAWGLGLERLAMFKYNLTDIRDIYIANVKWLREVPLCQL
jgi:phenylalanyl-tRNA synthetase alpha chain